MNECEIPVSTGSVQPPVGVNTDITNSSQNGIVPDMSVVRRRNRRFRKSGSYRFGESISQQLINLIHSCRS